MPEETEHPLDSLRVAEPGWEKQVLVAARYRCSNCGSNDRVKVNMIVSEEAGGRKVVSNGVVLCRACDMANDVVNRKACSGASRPINFWVSRNLFDQTKAYNGFSSTSALIRYLIDKYVEDESRFEDLEMFQDEGRDVKINVWVEPTTYDRFKELVDARGLTVTDALKNLLKMYGTGVEPQLLPRKEPLVSESSVPELVTPGVEDA
jgi:hypothetical protein